jgi:hypothetical protein
MDCNTARTAPEARDYPGCARRLAATRAAPWSRAPHAFVTVE